MKYILKYEYESKYLGFVKVLEKEFNYIQELRDFVLEHIERIHNFRIYKLTDLSEQI